VALERWSNEIWKIKVSREKKASAPLRLEKVIPARKLKFEQNNLTFQPKSLLTLAILAMKKRQTLILEQNKSLKKQLEDMRNNSK
jgi:hypothetical protein